MCCLLCKKWEDKCKVLAFIRVGNLNPQRSAVYKWLLETDILLYNKITKYTPAQQIFIGVYGLHVSTC